MGELVFPLSGLFVLFAIAVPVSTLLAKGLLLLARRARPEPWRAGSWWRYALLVAPVLGPVAWFVSAALHHAEPGNGSAACLWDEILCLEPIMLLVMVIAVTAAVALRRGAAARQAVARAPRVADAALERRLARLCHSRPMLRRATLAIVEANAVRTVGMLAPVIEVGKDVADALDDDSLVAALLHEAAHGAAHDPLRFVVVTICQALNPLNHLLAPELRRWRVGREQACDREAVHVGGHPLALAEAIVTAARRQIAAEPAGLAGHGAAAIRHRVTLLLGYVKVPPGCTCSRTGARVAFFAAIAMAVAPHLLDAWPLLELHTVIERALTTLIG